MTNDQDFPLEGGCTCKAIRYRMMTRPMFVHCCHCRWCQRETGTSFALNAMIEADRVIVLSGAPEDAQRVPTSRALRNDTEEASSWGSQLGRNGHHG